MLAAVSSRSAAGSAMGVPVMATAGAARLLRGGDEGGSKVAAWTGGGPASCRTRAPPAARPATPAQNQASGRNDQNHGGGVSMGR